MNRPKVSFHVMKPFIIMRSSQVNNVVSKDIVFQTNVELRVVFQMQMPTNSNELGFIVYLIIKSLNIMQYLMLTLVFPNNNARIAVHHH